MDDTYTGSRACGGVSHRAVYKPNFIAVCSCKFCQLRLPSAFNILATFDEINVEIAQGDLVECEHFFDESCRWLKMNFCSKCGTTVYHTAEVKLSLRGRLMNKAGSESTGIFGCSRSWIG